MKAIFIYRVVCAILSFILFIWSYTYKKVTSENKMLTIVFSSTFMFNVGLIWEIYCTNLESVFIVQRYNSLFVWCTLLSMYLFSARYTSTKIPKHAIVFYSITSMAANTAMSTAMNHNLFFQDVHLDESGLYPKLAYHLGILGHLFNALLVLFCIFAFIFAFKYYRKPSKFAQERTRKKTLLLSMCIPTVSFAFSKLFEEYHYDIILGGLLISSIILLFAAYHYKIFDVGSSAKKQMLDTMAQAMIISDKGFGFIYANQAAKQLFPECYTIKEGDSIWDLYQRLSTKELEIEGRIYEVNTKAVYEGSELGGFSTCLFDITERRNYEKQLIAKKNEADQANQAKSSFLARMSHEIRTPLNTIIGLSEIALRSPMRKELSYQIKSIRHSARSLLTIINSILDLSKLESGKVDLINDRYDLKELLYEISNMVLMDLAGRQVDYMLSVDPKIPYHLIGDYAKIRQILNNILSNAVKYTKAGMIRMNVTNQIVSDHVEVCFEVSDSGIGIHKEDLDSIFNTYERVEDSNNQKIIGTGLGLSIVQHYINMMQGSIEVQSDYGVGTTFRITIPQQMSDQECIGEVHLTTNEMEQFLDEDYMDVTKGITFQGAHILVVDDMEINLEVIKGLLNPYQMIIDQAMSADEAITKIQSVNYDLVFMDHMMPGKDGIQAVKEIRELPDMKYQHLPVIMITANAIIGMKEHVIKNGFQGYISKPIDQRKLRDILEKWLVKYQKYEPISQIDFDGGLRNVGNHLNQYIKILSTYETEMSSLMRHLPEMEHGDLNELRIKVHGIKGGSRSIGAAALGDYAAGLEERLKEGDTSHLSENILQLTDMMEILLDNIHAYLEQIQPEEKVTTTLKSDTVIDSIWWKKLYDIVSQYDSIQAIKMISEVGNVEDEMLKRQLNEISELLNTMEYERCKEKILLKL